MLGRHYGRCAVSAILAPSTILSRLTYLSLTRDPTCDAFEFGDPLTHGQLTHDQLTNWPMQLFDGSVNFIVIFHIPWKVIARVRSVHLTNIKQHQVAADSSDQERSTWAVRPPRRLISSTPTHPQSPFIAALTLYCLGYVAMCSSLQMASSNIIRHRFRDCTTWIY